MNESPEQQQSGRQVAQQVPRPLMSPQTESQTAAPSRSAELSATKVTSFQLEEELRSESSALSRSKPTFSLSMAPLQDVFSKVTFL